MIDYNRIPPRTLETLQAWIDTGRPMGSFCEAVVCNDLLRAVTCADNENRAALADVVAWMANNAPPACWGSFTNFERWSRHKRELLLHGAGR